MWMSLAAHGGGEVPRAPVSVLNNTSVPLSASLLQPSETEAEVPAVPHSLGPVGR
jgi:hypothetical protein